VSEIFRQQLPQESTTTTSTVEVLDNTQRWTLRQFVRSDLGFLPVLLTLIAITVYFTVTTNGIFLATGNISNLLQQISTIGVDGLGVSLVLLLGEIDLSVVSVGTLSAVVMGVLSERMGVPGWEAIIAGLFIGAVAGCINGFFIAVLRVPSFIVTLAASIVYAGLLLNLLAGQATLIVHDPLITAIAGSPLSFLPDIIGVGLPTLVLMFYAAALVVDQILRRRSGLRTRSLLYLIIQVVIVAIIVEGTIVVLENTPGPTPGTYLGVPNSAAILFGLILLIWLALKKTRFGRHVYAVGGNAEAARRAGIHVVGIRMAIFTLCSTLAAIGGMLAASRANAVASQISPTLLLDAIAAAVIGGISLFGGRGSVWSIVLGALIIGSLENGLDLRSQGSDVKQMIEGAVLLFAVTIDALVRHAQAQRENDR
jgi:D-xylose transport system permease protein